MTITRKRPPARVLVDMHFEREELARVLGTDDARALDLARRVTWPPLADLLARPGKSVRARLVEHAFAIAQGASPCECAQLPDELPQVLELLHAGSLVIDDVEDDAEERRGGPALHRTYGLPVAINTGNWLYFHPLLLLSSARLDAHSALAMHRRVARGLLRCHHGQSLDLSLRVHDLAQEEVAPAVELSTSLKTGALMELACAVGAIAAHAPPGVERALETFGREAGVALQMYDDLSGIIAEKRHDKGIEDLAGARPTWCWAWLAASLDEATYASFQRSARAVASGEMRAETLLAAMRPHLEHATERPRARLQAAIASLRAATANADLEPLVRDLRALEAGYV